MARLCMPSSRAEKFVRDENGRYKYLGVPTYFEKLYISVFNEMSNSSQFITELTNADCIQSLKANESDISVAPVPLDEVDYRVPVPVVGTTVDFIVGLDKSNQSDLHDGPPATKYGLLSNVYNFTLDTYAVTMIFVSIFVSLVYLKSCTMIIHLKILGRKKCIRRMFLLNLTKLRTCTADQLRSVCLLISLLHFLLSTPFLLMFKTNQVVNKTPFIIDSYERAIESNVTLLVTGLSTNETHFVQPNARDVQRDNLINVFWKLFQRNKLTFYPSQVIQGTIDKEINEITTGKSIFLADQMIGPVYRAVFCSYAIYKNMRIELFIYHDTNQREEVYGLAFRTAYNNQRVVKSLRRFDEMKLWDKIQKDGVEQSGDAFLPKDHDLRVFYRMCLLPNSLDPQASKNIPPSDFYLFAPLLLLCLFVYLVAGISLILEKVVTLKFTRRKRCNKIHPCYVRGKKK